MCCSISKDITSCRCHLWHSWQVLDVWWLIHFHGSCSTQQMLISVYFVCSSYRRPEFVRVQMRHGISCYLSGIRPVPVAVQNDSLRMWRHLVVQKMRLWLSFIFNSNMKAYSTCVGTLRSKVLIKIESDQNKGFHGVFNNNKRATTFLFILLSSLFMFIGLVFFL